MKKLAADAASIETYRRFRRNPIGKNFLLSYARNLSFVHLEEGGA